MDSKEKLLTVIIPTFNRGNILLGCLKAVLPFVKDNSNLVSVYVSDNASTDNTQEIVKQFQKNYSDVLQYKRQVENVGMFNNFRDAARNASAKYIALVGDDDYVLPSYIPTILKILLDNGGVGLVNVNLLSVSEHGFYIGTRDKMAVSGHIKHYDNGGDFLKEHLIVPSLISSNVFLREGFVKELFKVAIDDYPGYDWFYAMMLSVINKPCIYFDLPLLIQRQPDGDNMRWIKQAPLYHIYGFGRIFRDLDKYSSGLEKAWMNFFESDPTSKYLLKIISNNRDMYKDKYPLFKDYSPSKKYTVQLYLFTHFPVNVAKSILKLLKLVSYIFRK